MNKNDIRTGIKQFENVREIIKKKRELAGLPAPPAPANSEGLYAKWEALKNQYGGLSKVPFTELGDFLDEWTGLVAYARYCEGIALVDLTTAREIRDTVKKQLYTLQEGGRELRDASVHIESIYIEWERKYIEAEAMYVTTRSLREGYEKRADAISREITRRGADVLDTRRGINRGNVS